MKFRKVISIIALSTIVFSSFLHAFAHPSSVSSLFDGETLDGNYYVGNESMGWSIDESYHTNSTSITYKFASNVGVTLRMRTNNCTSKWPSPFSISESSSAIGTITVASLQPYVVAAFSEYTANSSGHLTSWKIKVNSAYEETISMTEIAHEFGHVFGLNDLYSSSNMNKLMYYSDDRTVVKAQAKDKWGAKVITGDHTSHTWAYEYVSQSQHHKYCTSCGGYKTQACTYDANGTCTKCGHHVSINLLPPPEPVTAVLPKAERRRSEA